MFRRIATAQLPAASLLFFSFFSAAAILPTRQNSNSANALYGINFSPYESGQDPNVNPQVSADQIKARLQIIAPYAVWVRSYSVTTGLENIPPIARSLNLKVAAGAWLSTNLTQNSAEIANLIAAAKAGNVDLAIVGSEVLLRGDLTESQLIAYMNQVRQAIPAGIPVTTADSYGTLLAHPNVLAASDVIAANVYPYWEFQSVGNAVCDLIGSYNQLAAAATGKQIIISEAGWPSGGDAQGAAVPSPANAAQFFLQFVSWARANNVPFFYFEAFDEAWKANYEGPQGAYWGIWDQFGNIKPLMQPVLAGQTTPVSCDSVPSGPGSPLISFTYVPPYGSTDSLEGQELHVSTASYAVAVYIQVGGGWWTKPTFAQPRTPIQSDGSWSSAIVTGGSDQLATAIAAFLIPNAYTPPALSGASSLPNELFQNSVKNVQTTRSQNSISGQITSGGLPLAGVTVLLSGAQSATTQTAPDGKYSFVSLSSAGPYTVTPSGGQQSFSPVSQTFVSVTGNQAASFSASPTILSVSSPSLNFSYPVGSGQTTTYSLNVASSPTTGVAFSASNGGCNWLDLTSATSVTPAGVNAAVDLAAASGLRPGTYNCWITVNAPGASNSPIVIPATLQVADLSAQQFIPVTPCRVLDTRYPAGPFGGPEMAAGSTRTFAIPTSTCGIPSSATAYALNVTVVPDAVLGYLEIWPTGQSQPLVSTLNSDGRVKANAVIVPAGTNGGVDIFVSHSTQVIVDINGYFVPAGTSSALAFFPLTPCRIADTRSPVGSLGGPYLVSGQGRSFPILPSSCNVPSAARAYSLNFTAIPHGPLGFLATWPTGQPQPLASTLNSSTGTVTANAAIVPAGTNGAIMAYASSDSDLVIDINGYFGPPAAGGLSLYILTPCRVLDTRSLAGSEPFSGTMTVNVSGSGCSAPIYAQAYVLNATVVPPGILGYLALWPDGQSQPVVSTLNADPGTVTSNMAIVPAANGSIDAFASQPTHLILDISSYFAQ